MATTNRRPRSVTRTTTHEGGVAVRPPPQHELLLTAVSTFLGEDTFYESAKERETRLRELVHTVTDRDPALVERIAADLRNDYKIRTAAVLVACEYVAARGPHGRRVIDSVIQRPDECAEVISYWHTRHGRHLPWALRMGVKDAAVRVYTERNVLKYDSRNALVSPADVIELTHPRPRAEWQRKLFGYLLDERHHGDGIERSNELDLPMLHAHHYLGQVPEAERRTHLRDVGAATLAQAGYTWEALSGWLPGGMDAEAWELVIPQMGVMALLRNLRNFDEAGISTEARGQVVTKITDAEEVAKSRIFPYRVMSAYKAAPSDYWKVALQETLEHTVPVVPRFDRSLFLIDVSGSMDATMSARSQVKRLEVGALMALVAYRGSENVDIVAFGTSSKKATPRKGQSVVSQAAGFHNPGVGHATQGYTAMRHWFDPKRHDRAVFFTDCQFWDSDGGAHPPMVVFNLAGYAPQPDWGKGCFYFGGLSDAAFRLAEEITRPSS